MQTSVTSQSSLDGLAEDSQISPRRLLALYGQMLLIRRFELTVQEVNKQGEAPGFIHLYVGEEATAVGVCAHLRPHDWITGKHRGHGHALASDCSIRVG